jgi:hypothetical protein
MQNLVTDLPMGLESTTDCDCLAQEGIKDTASIFV